MQFFGLRLYNDNFAQHKNCTNMNYSEDTKSDLIWRKIFVTITSPEYIIHYTSATSVASQTN